MKSLWRKLRGLRLTTADTLQDYENMARVRFVVKVRREDTDGHFTEFREAFNVNAFKGYVLARYSSAEGVECFQPLNYGDVQVAFGVMIDENPAPYNDFLN